MTSDRWLDVRVITARRCTCSRRLINAPCSSASAGDLGELPSALPKLRLAVESPSLPRGCGVALGAAWNPRPEIVDSRARTRSGQPHGASTTVVAGRGRDHFTRSWHPRLTTYEAAASPGQPGVDSVQRGTQGSPGQSQPSRVGPCVPGQLPRRRASGAVARPPRCARSEAASPLAPPRTPFPAGWISTGLQLNRSRVHSVGDPIRTALDLERPKGRRGEARPERVVAGRRPLERGRWRHQS